MNNSKPLVGITTQNHVCQHVDEGVCRPCHVPMAYHASAKPSMHFGTTKKGMARHEKTPALLKAAMRANEPFRSDSGWETFVDSYSYESKQHRAPRPGHYRLG